VLPILLQGTPPEIEQEIIIQKIKEIEEIANIHDLHIWSLDEDYHILTVHVRLATTLPMEQLAELKTQIRTVLKNEKIAHATIEFEMPAEVCGYEGCGGKEIIY
jgi:cobalt-zinc-cadmium efflux system protein